MMKCPFCREEIIEDALKCRYCGNWIGNAMICPQCAESVAAEAKSCKFCGYNFPKVEIGAETSGTDELTIESTPLGALLCEWSITGLFFPPRLSVLGNEIQQRRWGLMGLRTYDSNISSSKIASVRYVNGVIWASLVLETYGGSVPDLVIRGLDKEEAREMAALLDRIAKQQKPSFS